MGNLASQMRSLALEGDDESSGMEQTPERRPVILILDDTLQGLPWEGLPGLQRQR